MQSTKIVNDPLQDMIKRQNELQYTAMAHALEGQELPAEYVSEYAVLEKSINQLTYQRLVIRMNEMQYAAMAHSLSGQPLPDDFAAEYAELEQQINRLK